MEQNREWPKYWINSERALSTPSPSKVELMATTTTTEKKTIEICTNGASLHESLSCQQQHIQAASEQKSHKKKQTYAQNANRWSLLIHHKVLQSNRYNVKLAPLCGFNCVKCSVGVIYVRNDAKHSEAQWMRPQLHRHLIPICIVFSVLLLFLFHLKRIYSIWLTSSMT